MALFVSSYLWLYLIDKNRTFGTCSVFTLGLTSYFFVSHCDQVLFFVSPAKQKGDICIAFPALSLAAA